MGKTGTVMNASIGTSLTQRIGNTPLLRFARVTAELDDVQVLAKAEWGNPGGSVKDRAVSNIVGRGVEGGKLGAGEDIAGSTSGNTGIAYAMLGAAYGIPVTLCVPSNVSAERKRILRAYRGANHLHRSGRWLRRSNPESPRMAAAEPEKYYYADQYSDACQLARPLLERNRRRDLAAERRPGVALRRRARAPAEHLSAHRAD